MVVYVVMKTTYQSFSNDACWDDGWYDDYYETEVESSELIGIYATEELARKVCEEENDKCSGYDCVNYFPYTVIEDNKNSKKAFLKEPTEESIKRLQKLSKASDKKCFK